MPYRRDILPKWSATNMLIMFLGGLGLLCVVFPEIFLENLISILIIGVLGVMIFRGLNVSILTIFISAMLLHVGFGVALYFNFALHDKTPDSFVDFVASSHMNVVEEMINEGIENYHSEDPAEQSLARRNLFYGFIGEFPFLLFLWGTISQVLSKIKGKRRSMELGGTAFVEQVRTKDAIINTALALSLSLLVLGYIFEPIAGTFVPGIVRIVLLLVA